MASTPQRPRQLNCIYRSTPSDGPSRKLPRSLSPTHANFKCDAERPRPVPGGFAEFPVTWMLAVTTSLPLLGNFFNGIIITSAICHGTLTGILLLKCPNRPKLLQKGRLGGANSVRFPQFAAKSMERPPLNGRSLWSPSVRSIQEVTAARADRFDTAVLKDVTICSCSPRLTRRAA